MRISDWSSDVCSSDLSRYLPSVSGMPSTSAPRIKPCANAARIEPSANAAPQKRLARVALKRNSNATPRKISAISISSTRSEEHTSELQSLMRISYDVFCLKKQNNKTTQNYHQNI